MNTATPCFQGRALVVTETWQSGLLQPAYTGPSVEASIPSTALRRFESYRFRHHLKSGSDHCVNSDRTLITTEGLDPKA